MWFGTLNLYYLDGPAPEIGALEAALASKPYRACTPRQEQSIGFANPWSDDVDSFTYGVMGSVFMCLKLETREVPGAVIREEVEKRGRALLKSDPLLKKVGSKTKAALKEQVKHELLPKAFSKMDRVQFYIDTRANLLVINASNAKKVDALRALLSGFFPDTKFCPVRTQREPMAVMTEWVRAAGAPGVWEIGHKAVLGCVEDKSAIQYRAYEIESDDYIREYTRSERQVTSLELEWDNKISFVLKDDALMTGVKFIGESLSELENETGGEGEGNARDAILALMPGTVRELYDALLGEFGGLMKFDENENAAPAANEEEELV